MNSITAYKSVDAIAPKKVVDQHAPMVKRIAQHLKGRLPKTVQIEDLIQAGMIGLLEAANNYDESRGASFETYAGIRIRGNMLDEVRKNDWMPRSIYRNTRKISEVVHSLENKLGREPKDFEIAEELDVDIEEYFAMVRDYNSGQVFGLDDAGVNDDNFSHALVTNIIEPLEVVERENFQKHLTEAIATLPERERLTLALYYDEELNLKEIGEILEVSESRVCQIHSQAMSRLQNKIRDWK